MEKTVFFKNKGNFFFKQTEKFLLITLLFDAHHCLQSLNPLLIDSKHRYHGVCVTHTVSGRISMHEPNLQNVPKDFEVNDLTFSCRSTFRPKDGLY